MIDEPDAHGQAACWAGYLTNALEMKVITGSKRTTQAEAVKAGALQGHSFNGIGRRIPQLLEPDRSALSGE